MSQIEPYIVKPVIYRYFSKTLNQIFNNSEQK